VNNNNNQGFIQPTEKAVGSISPWSGGQGVPTEIPDPEINVAYSANVPFDGFRLQDCRNMNYLDCVRYQIFRKKHLARIRRKGPNQNFGNMRSKGLRRIMNNNTFEGEDFSLMRGNNFNLNNYYLVPKSSVKNMNDSLLRLKKYSENQSKLIALLMGQNGQNKQTIKKLNKQFQALYKNDSEIQKSFRTVLNEMRQMADIKVPPHHDSMGFDVKNLTNNELADLLKMDRSIFTKKSTRNPANNNSSTIKQFNTTINMKSKRTSNNNNNTSTNNQNNRSNDLQEKLRKLKRNSQNAMNRLNRKKQTSPNLFSNNSNNQNLGSSFTQKTITKTINSSGGNNASGNSRGSGRQSGGSSESNIFNSGFGIQMNQDFGDLDLNNFINNATSQIKGVENSKGGNAVGNVEITIEKTTSNSNVNDSS
jgi:hypothetical protein